MQFEAQKTCFGAAETQGGPTPPLCRDCEIRYDCESEARNLHRSAQYERTLEKSPSQEKITRRVAERDRLNVLWEDTKAAETADRLRKERQPMKPLDVPYYQSVQQAQSFVGAYAINNPLSLQAGCTSEHLNMKGYMLTSVQGEEVPAPEDDDEKEEIMATEITKTGTSLAATGSKALKAVKRGASTAAVDEIGEELVDIATEVLPSDMVATLASSPEGRSVLKGGMALVLLHLSGTETLADYPGVESACTLELEAVSRDLVQPRLKKLRGSLGRLSALGRKKD